MSYKVHTESFEGPFDLLLYLVSSQKIDVGTISITQIIDQYLEEVAHMQNLDLDIASDFLLVAATLLNIKAQRLVPKQVEDIDDDIVDLEPNEARDILISKLIVYKQYKNVADVLNKMYISTGKMHTRSFGPDREYLNVVPDYLKDTSLENLAMLAANCFARREMFLLDAEHIAAQPISINDTIKNIHTEICSKKNIRFSELIKQGSSASVIVVTFLAVLELCRRSMVYVSQDNEFDDIQIEYIEGSGELVLVDGEDPLLLEE